MATKLSLRQMEHVVALSRARSLRAAAATLGITESALGSSIDQVEKLLGQPISIRKRAVGATMTPAGVLLADRSRDILRQVVALEAELSGITETLNGTVRCGVSTSLVPELAVELAARVQERHPGLVVEIHPGMRVDLLAGLDSGTLDLAVLFVATEVELYPHARVADVPVMLALSGAGRWADATSVEDVLEEPFILVESPLGRGIAQRIFDTAGRTPTETRRVDTLNVALAMVAAGAGFGLFPDTRILRIAGGSRVRLLPLPEGHEPARVIVAWSQRTRLSPDTEAVRDLIVESGAELLAPHADTSAV